MSPLADLLRPASLNDFTGQTHLVGKGKPIRLAIEKHQIHSMVFWGPPGCGKTTLARIIAREVQAQFHHLSAVAAGKADVRKIVAQAKQPSPPSSPPDQPSFISESANHHRDESIPSDSPKFANNSHQFVTGTILFLDEIHRFNKAQQDYLLPYVEDGTLTLIGATTENPSFSVISPLLSRCQVFVFEPLSEDHLQQIITRGLKKLDPKHPHLPKQALDFLIQFSNGDARQALNLLEATNRLYQEITPDNLKQALQSKFLRYDRAGEEHYNLISAFIKSMRASQPDAALYYLARMVDSGEDPLFIARRMVVFASEDIGLAQPTALVVANAVLRACETIGYPECQENLAHGTVYLAQAKKDRSAYDAYFRALDDAKRHGNLPVPMSIRNAPTKLMKDLGYGKGYQKYTQESLLPDKLKHQKYLHPKNEP
jgi:putative ATPase